MQAHSLGLYVSSGQTGVSYTEPAVFSEPALFGVNPQGVLQFVNVSNAPFLRPEVGLLMMVLKHVIDTGYPVWGTRAA